MVASLATPVFQDQGLQLRSGHLGLIINAIFSLALALTAVSRMVATCMPPFALTIVAFPKYNIALHTHSQNIFEHTHTLTYTPHAQKTM